jgi:hypothetical protein
VSPSDSEQCVAHAANLAGDNASSHVSSIPGDHFEPDRFEPRPDAEIRARAFSDARSTTAIAGLTLSGFWPDLGQTSEFRPIPGQHET